VSSTLVVGPIQRILLQRINFTDHSECAGHNEQLFLRISYISELFSLQNTYMYRVGTRLKADSLLKYSCVD